MATSSKPARVSIARAPWPTAGHICSARQDFGDAVAPAQALEAGGGQQNRVVLAFVELAQARVEIAAHGFHLEIWPELAQLRGAAKRTGADLGAYRQIGQLAAHYGVARIFALRDRGQHEAFGQFGGQVFQTVHGEVGAAIEQRLLDLFGEEALGADLGQRDVGDFVAGGLDDLDAALAAGGGELRGDPMGLPQSELRTTGCDDEHE